MNFHQIFDAANPPASAPLIAEGALGYLGGPRATHTWTLDQWQPFSKLRQFPAYVPDIGTNPLSQAREAVQLALALGWSDKMQGAEQRAIIVDMETSADPAWYDKFATDVSAHGFMAVAYGSLSTVLGNAADDVIAADWNWDVPTIPPGQTFHGGQYTTGVKFGGTVLDYSSFDDWLFNRGGVGKRHRVG